MKRIKALLIIVLVLFAQFTILLNIGILPAHASGENWLTGYSYRRSLLVTNSSQSAGTGYQVQLFLVNGTSEGASTTIHTNDTITINNKTRSDFGDVNFTDNGGSICLDYWLETLNSGLNATFRVEVAGTLTATNQTIYVYYGYASSTTASSLANTFPAFADDFEANNINKWNSTTDTANYGTQSGTVKAGSYAGYNTAAAGVATMNWTTDLAYGYMDECWIRATTAASDSRFYLRINFTDKHIGLLSLGANSGKISYGNYAGSLVDICSFSVNTWYELRIGHVSKNSTDFFIYSANNNLVGSATGINDWYYALKSGADNDFIRLYGGLTSGTGYHDSVILRKYVNPEPGFGTWGSEEVYSVTPNSNTVTLGTPANAGSTNNLTSNFTYTPVFGIGIIQNSSLWTNATGSWSSTQGNQSLVANNTLNGISYTFSSYSTIIWNVAVANTTAYVYASSNWTLYVVQAPQYSNVATNTTAIGNTELFSSYWTASSGLSGYIFGWNGTVGSTVSNGSRTFIAGNSTRSLFTDSIIQASNGSLLNFIDDNTGPGSSPPYWIDESVSNDNGATWSSPTVWLNTTGSGLTTGFGIVHMAPNGNLLVVISEGDYPLTAWNRTGCKISTDGGYTWGATIWWPKDGSNATIPCPANLINVNTTIYALCNLIDYSSGYWGLDLYKSTDNGTSWSIASNVYPISASGGGDEASIIWLYDQSKFLVMSRDMVDANNNTWTKLSSDYTGTSWGSSINVGSYLGHIEQPILQWFGNNHDEILLTGRKRYSGLFQRVYSWSTDWVTWFPTQVLDGFQADSIGGYGSTWIFNSTYALSSFASDLNITASYLDLYWRPLTRAYNSTFVNSTWTSLSGSASWVNVTRYLDFPANTFIQWQVWVNGTGNYWNDTGLQSFTTTLTSNIEMQFSLSGALAASGLLSKSIENAFRSSSIIQIVGSNVRSAEIFFSSTSSVSILSSLTSSLENLFNPMGALTVSSLSGKGIEKPFLVFGILSIVSSVAKFAENLFNPMNAITLSSLVSKASENAFSSSGGLNIFGSNIKSAETGFALANSLSLLNVGVLTTGNQYSFAVSSLITLLGSMGKNAENLFATSNSLTASSYLLFGRERGFGSSSMVTISGLLGKNAETLFKPMNTVALSSLTSKTVETLYSPAVVLTLSSLSSKGSENSFTYSNTFTLSSLISKATETSFSNIVTLSLSSLVSKTAERLFASQGTLQITTYLARATEKVYMPIATLQLSILTGKNVESLFSQSGIIALSSLGTRGIEKAFTSTSIISLLSLKQYGLEFGSSLANSISLSSIVSKAAESAFAKVGTVQLIDFSSFSGQFLIGPGNYFYYPSSIVTLFSSLTVAVEHRYVALNSITFLSIASLNIEKAFSTSNIIQMSGISVFGKEKGFTPTSLVQVLSRNTLGNERGFSLTSASAISSIISSGIEKGFSTSGIVQLTSSVVSTFQTYAPQAYVFILSEINTLSSFSRQGIERFFPSSNIVRSLTSTSLGVEKGFLSSEVLKNLGLNIYGIEKGFNPADQMTIAPFMSMLSELHVGNAYSFFVSEFSSVFDAGTSSAENRFSISESLHIFAALGLGTGPSGIIVNPYVPPSIIEINAILNVKTFWTTILSSGTSFYDFLILLCYPTQIQVACVPPQTITVPPQTSTTTVQVVSVFTVPGLNYSATSTSMTENNSNKTVSQDVTVLVPLFGETSYVYHVATSYLVGQTLLGQSAYDGTLTVPQWWVYVWFGVIAALALTFVGLCVGGLLWRQKKRRERKDKQLTAKVDRLVRQRK